MWIYHDGDLEKKLTTFVRYCFVSLFSFCFVMIFLCSGAKAQLTVYSSVSALRASVTTDSQVLLSGYYSAGDGGGGLLVYTGRSCAPVTIMANWTSGMPQLTNVVGMTNIVPGDATTISQNGFPDYDLVTQIDTVNKTINLAVAPSSNGNGSPLTLSCDNSGTAFGTRSQALASKAYTRAQSNFSQDEWGAINIGTDTTDRAPNLQNWLNAPQPHIAVPGTVYIGSPLVCPAGGSIQGAPTTAVAENSSILPAFTIIAEANFANVGTNAAMLVMPANQSCGIHGVGLIASSPSMPSGAVYDTVDAMGVSDLIDGHAYLSGGNKNVNTGSGGSGPTANFEAYDSSFNNSVSTNLVINSSNTKILRNAISGAGTGIVTVTTTGPISSGTSNIPLASVAHLVIGMTVYGSAFAASTNISAINTSTKTITINPAAITLAAAIPAGTTIAATAGDGDNIRFGGKEAVIGDNIIQNAGGWGINMPTARSVRVRTNFSRSEQLDGPGGILLYA